MVMCCGTFLNIAYFSVDCVCLYISDTGPCKIRTCHAAVEGHEVAVVKLGTTQKAALKNVIVYIS
jgi:hypothetical protein